MSTQVTNEMLYAAMMDLKAELTNFKSEMYEFRTEMRSEIKDVRTEMKDIRIEIKDMRTEYNHFMKNAEIKFSRPLGVFYAVMCAMISGTISYTAK